MKKIVFLLLSILLIVACDDAFKDDREFEPAKIVAIKINDVLYTIEQTDSKVAKVVLPPGTNLTTLKTDILVANGILTNFDKTVPQNLVKPIDVTIKGENGETTTWKVIVQSPPLLVNLSVQGLSIPQSKVNIGFTSIIVEIPVGTVVNNLRVSFTFLNGTLQSYVNGTQIDYSSPFKLAVLGSDGITVYNYDVVFTSDPVGPAVIKGMIINGIQTSQMVVIDPINAIVQPIVPFLSNFGDATIVMQVPFGSVIEPTLKTTNVDLLKGFKVKIKGTNGVETNFTVRNPLIRSTPILSRSHVQLQFASNAGTSAGFSGNSIVIAAHAMEGGAAAPFGINAYDLAGNFINSLARTGTNFDGGALTGVRKLATDDDGRILGVQLGAGATGATNLSIFRWNSISDQNPTTYINFSQNSLGIAGSARTGGINISGSLASNAIISVTIAQRTEVIIWRVTNGILNPTPEVRTFPYGGTGFYYSVEPYSDGFVGASTGSNFSGINLMSSSLNESFKITGTSTTDARAITYKGRKYVAYVTYRDGRHRFRMVDITTPSVDALSTFIIDVERLPLSNGNVTVDADFRIINNKLHVLFYGTNDGLAVYQLEP